MNNLDEERQIWAYFLGELTEDEVSEIDRRCFEDEQFAEIVLIREDELIEAYHAGALGAEQRDHFEKNYLTSSVRRARFELLSNLRNKQLSDSRKPLPLFAEPERKTHSEGFMAWWRETFPAPAKLGIVLGALLLFVCLIGLYRLIQRPIEPSIELTRVTAPERTSDSLPSPNPSHAAQIVEENPTHEGNPTDNGNSTNKAPAFSKSEEPKSNNRTNSALPETKKNTIVVSDDMPVHGNARSSAKAPFVAFNLLPGGLRADGKQTDVVISAKDKAANLNLTLRTEEGQAFRAELQTAEGNTIWSSPNLKARRAQNGARTVGLQIPARFLEERLYVLMLYADKINDAPVADYTFKVKTKQ